jgi:hypothetical protein
MRLSASIKNRISNRGACAGDTYLTDAATAKGRSIAE